jgi:hypothetical protein
VLALGSGNEGAAHEMPEGTWTIDPADKRVLDFPPK